jgi:hypothetical protein
LLLVINWANSASPNTARLGRYQIYSLHQIISYFRFSRFIDFAMHLILYLDV